MRNKFRTMIKRCVNYLLLVSIALLIPCVATAGDVNSSVDMKFWGRAIFNTHYDTSAMATEYMSYLNDDKTTSWNFNPRDTRFGFSAGQSIDSWAYRAVFEMDFYGSNAGNNLLPRLRLGYVEAKNSESGFSVRGGQDWIPVAAQNPGTIDFGVMSWGGNIWWRVPQLTVRYKPANWEFLVSAMKHRISNTQETQEKMPWILGRVAGSNLLGEGSLIALGGGVRSVTLNDGDTIDIENEYSPYMVAFELKVPLGKKFILNGEVYSGQGIGREFVHYGFDFNPEHPEGSTEIESMGGFASLKYLASAKVELNGGFGMDDPKDEDMVGIDDNDIRYLKNQSFFLNFKHKITKKFGWGLEVISLTTNTAVGNGDTRTNVDLKGERYTTSMWFVF